jgi:hypothetical protein|tara:strand:+ start:7631 stop:8002 length:372 start_codon:yes stop_codon:yes gene_type:complete
MTTYNTELTTLNKGKDTFDTALSQYKDAYEKKIDNPTNTSDQSAFDAIDTTLSSETSNVRAMNNVYAEKTAILQTQLDSLQNASGVLLGDILEKNNNVLFTNITLLMGISIFSWITYKSFKKE